MSILAGARVVTPDQILYPGWIEIIDGTIAAVGAGRPPSGPTDDLGGAWVMPGFVDIHMHGGGGHDAARSPEDLSGAVRFHLTHGTTSTLVSLVTAPATDLREQLGWIAEARLTHPTVIGAHLEGPFLSAARCGAQNPAHLQAPDTALFTGLLTAARSALRLITVAPELPGSSAVIRAARAAGVMVALGHSDATYDQAMAAIEAGATVATHLYNGMRPLGHREPGLAGAALDAALFCEMINDGHHLHPAVVRMTSALLPHRMVLVTDAVDAAGGVDGPTALGGQSVNVVDGVARLAHNGALAGSTLTMETAVRRSIVDAGLDVQTVARAAATTPARAIGIDGRTGVIRVGLAADLVVLDHRFGVQKVLLAGEALLPQ